jgi:hypothetical protein
MEAIKVAMPVIIRNNEERRSVYLITSPDGGIIFDLDNDKFLKLDPIGAEIWVMLTGGAAENAVVTVIAQKYEVELQRVADDVGKLLQDAADAGIAPSCIRHRQAGQATVEQTGSPTFPWYGQNAAAVRPTPRAFTTIRALLALALFDLVLSTRSLKFLCQLVAEWPVRELDRRPDPLLAGRICVAVERACVWYPKKALCLQRSSVTTCLLRGAGLPARMVIAARVMPMLSHAWVEIDGSVVNDHPKVRTVYQPLISL